jgi:hypothetical protein
MSSETKKREMWSAVGGERMEPRTSRGAGWRQWRWSATSLSRSIVGTLSPMGRCSRMERKSSAALHQADQQTAERRVVLLRKTQE